MSKPLTTEEIEVLPDGERVVIIWQGGNGPHEYVTRVDRFGARRFYAIHPHTGQETFVGGISDVRYIERLVDP